MLNSYTEYSVSDGVHCIAYGSLPTGGRKRGSHELYSDVRYFVVTGRRVPNTPTAVDHREAELHALHMAIFGTAESTVPSVPKPLHASPNTQGGGGEGDSLRFPLSDSAVIQHIQNDAAARRYWIGCPEGTNPSEADWALACKLAFYTGRNIDQADRIFRQSALANRPKAISRRGQVDYVRRTVQLACEQQRAIWQPMPREKNSPARNKRVVFQATHAVEEFVSQYPHLPPREIGRLLGLSSGAVRVALCRLRRAARSIARGLVA
jgi:primase-polymerase (primpol)-like protein